MTSLERDSPEGVTQVIGEVMLREANRVSEDVEGDLRLKVSDCLLGLLLALLLLLLATGCLSFAFCLG